MHNPNRPEGVLKMNANDEGEGGDDAADALRYGVVAYKEFADSGSYEVEVPYQTY